MVAPPLKGGIGSRDIDLDLPDIDLRGCPSARSRSPATTALVAVAIAFAITSDDEVAPAVERPDRPVTVCNGRAELCARPLNEVVFAGTHNSMSAAEEPGWYFAGHEEGIAEQLDFGVRALLIDTHYGIRDNKGNVRTDLEREGTNREKIVNAIGEEGLAAAERLVGRIGFGELEGQERASTCATRSASWARRRSWTGCGTSARSSTRTPTSS